MVAIKNLVAVALAGFTIAAPLNTTFTSSNSAVAAPEPAKSRNCDHPLGRMLMRVLTVPSEKRRAAKDRWVQCLRNGTGLSKHSKNIPANSTIITGNIIKCIGEFAKALDLFAEEKGCPMPKKKEWKGNEPKAMETKAPARKQRPLSTLTVAVDFLFCLKDTMDNRKCIQEARCKIAKLGKEEARQKTTQKVEPRGLAIADDDDDNDLLVADYIEGLALDSDNADEVMDSMFAIYLEVGTAIPKLEEAVLNASEVMS
ncbi:hypothetical protein CH63R_02315 [Colletotrichum higginsianum IMI 349063]|uniref:Uncharacterized protein n=2 Tax=Colletotrichum higginsianum TaxID=80884 RepID=A0A1B7YNK3_COLHI|nr:hypothetical protein CH63R_02315 [Colletotrichum higginsianum IMI 349063]OBR13589.1 hypothetical protein CH63R_02315 [Colletotrichum higginsianum IMI 349063]TID02267.1 hypothetical protein CH35J_003806 [Colletotrichum higginsianum]